MGHLRPDGDCVGSCLGVYNYIYDNYPDKTVDIYLDEFTDEIDSWVIDALKNIGCYTAKSVLALSREELIERADLEETTVDEVLAILSAEFEDESQE